MPTRARIGLRQVNVVGTKPRLMCPGVPVGNQPRGWLRESDHDLVLRRSMMGFATFNACDGLRYLQTCLRDLAAHFARGLLSFRAL